MNDQLTTKAQEALSVAVRSAATAGHSAVEPVHLMRALLAQTDGLTRPLLEAAGADAAAVGRDVDAALAAGFVINAPRPNVLRLAPPLIISADELDGFIDTLPSLIDHVA